MLCELKDVKTPEEKVPWVPKAEDQRLIHKTCISHNPHLDLPRGSCIRREGVFSYKMMISFHRSSELPIRFPVFLVSLGSPSTATSTNELIRGWRLCTLGFADTTGRERQKKSRMSQRAPNCPPVAHVLPLFCCFLQKKKFCFFFILKRLF